MTSVFNLFVRSMPFYSVARGRLTGVFATWPQCEAQVKGFTSAIYKKFSTYDEAVKFVISKGGKLDHKIDGESIADGDSQKSSKQIASAVSTGSSNKRLNEDVSESKPSKKAKKDTGEIPVKRLNKYGKHSFLEDENGFVHVFTDGSCEGNGTEKAVAGLGVYFGEGHALNVAKPVSGRATNNCGEIQASTLAIQLAGDCGVTKLCINTDSQFLINSITKWMTGWKRNGWKLKSGQPVKNVIDFKSLDAVTAKYSIAIKWNYVKAHCGILGNERADALAKQGGEMYRNGLRS
ncbi:ribonuclease H1 [Bradysia coprophila]|uniref:ribonuclease H1 n=1 Tax=Bradysia coprophila TaxID=38358 RepID=UPI00187DBB0C|nr:ribonuclease H1 [Bradysia coprophila]